MPLPSKERLTATERVLQQFIEALLFERYVNLDECHGSELAISPLNADGCNFSWRLGSEQYCVKGKVGGFGRIHIDIATLSVNGEPCPVPKVALAQLLDDLPAVNHNRLMLSDEFTQTVRLCEWNTSYLPIRPSRRRDSYTELECRLDEGHPYHPSYKARTGFSFEDHQQYGPEAESSFQLEWLAIKSTHLQMALPAKHDQFWLQQLGRESWKRLTSRLAECGARWGEYALMPVHPWQAKQLMNSWLPQQQRQAIIISLGAVGDNYIATQSVRTLANSSLSSKPHIKLPMNMVNTSSRRTLDPYSVCHAPAISSWLQSVVASDQALSNLALLPEFAGALFKPPLTPIASEPADGQLAMIMRESPLVALKAGEQAVPFNALMMVEHDGAPYIADWVEKFGLDAWLNQLLDVVITPVWHLLVKHGIALEAHGQNMVLVVRDGWPERLIVRDFHESVEFNRDFLAAPERLPAFLASGDDYYQVESVELLRELVMDTLFIYNLTEVAHLLATSYHLSEQSFWSSVNRCLNQYLLAHPELSERLTVLGYDQPQVLTESLLTRKLTASKEECHHLVPNPLSSKK
ncbi:IucA/IucC family siderophore biosynthesis protein [Photobacterium sanctipauli]|uniref:IucA/IucC family siderophore biosynthesis protein n=1 Tax=Photobacterium sanctipauli TaxID=1342794 RepID=A0A2T3NB59_9GAMM|nr:IucA/IucC family protein [Photobacterium sanctipauli]PSW11052.1 IucA/IucC family siderophore biosynthesis protein [Photobacterium sanctipauli]